EPEREPAEPQAEDHRVEERRRRGELGNRRRARPLELDSHGPLEGDAVALGLTREELLDGAKVPGVETVDEGLRSGAAVAVHGVHGAPRRVVPIGAPRASEILRDGHEREDIKKNRDPQASHSPPPRMPSTKKETRRWERRVRSFLLSEFTVSVCGL